MQIDRPINVFGPQMSGKTIWIKQFTAMYPTAWEQLGFGLWNYHYVPYTFIVVDSPNQKKSNRGNLQIPRFTDSVNQRTNETPHNSTTRLQLHRRVVGAYTRMSTSGVQT